MKPQGQQRLVRAAHLCLICFERTDHIANACPNTKYSCKCGGRHNYLLHYEFKNPKYDNSKSDKTTSDGKSNDTKSEILESKSTNVCAPERKLVLLPTVVTRFQSGDRYGNNCRVMLDSCSQPTLISDTFVRRFNLPIVSSKDPGPIKVGGINCNVRHSVFITIFSRSEPFKLTFEADVVPASALAYSVDRMIPASIHNQLRQFSLADDALRQPNIQISNVDILLGAEFYEQCLCNETRTIEGLRLRLTHFGWTVTGATEPSNQRTLFSGLTIREINDNLQKFWELEEMVPDRTEKPEWAQCVDHFETNTKLTPANEFEVRLPFKID